MSSHRPTLFRSFLEYYRPHWALFWGDTACAIVQAGTELAFPVILRGLADGLFSDGSEAILSNLWWICLGLVFMYAVRYGCRYFVSCWGHIMGARMESAMRRDLFDQYERFSFSYFDRHNTGDLMSRLVSDLFDIAEAAHHLPRPSSCAPSRSWAPSWSCSSSTGSLPLPWPWSPRCSATGACA